MKLGENIDLDELLLDPVLFVFDLPFAFSGGGPILGSQSTKNTHMRGNFRVPIQEM